MPFTVGGKTYQSRDEYLKAKGKRSKRKTTSTSSRKSSSTTTSASPPKRKRRPSTSTSRPSSSTTTSVRRKTGPGIISDVTSGAAKRDQMLKRLLNE